MREITSDYKYGFLIAWANLMRAVARSPYILKLNIIFLFLINSVESDYEFD